MAFRIERGAFKIFDTATNQFKERFKFNDDGNFVELNADGTEKGATFTTDGGTVTGETHFTHTSNTYAGASATLGSYYINDSNIRLHEGGNNALRITSPTGWVQFGSENTSYAHFNTDRSQFYFNRAIVVAGSALPYTDDTYNLGSSSLRWNNVYADSFRGYGNTIINGDLNVGGTITAQEFHTEFVNQTVIQEDGDVQVDGDIFLSGAATTTDQGYGIHWTGFDKEGTTDFSDAAYIRHVTNTGGHTGSVLLISSRNDASDGIAFDTHASSSLKHNGSIIWSENNQLYQLTAADVNGVSRNAWASNYTSGTAANRVVNHSTVYTLGGVNTLQLSTNTDYDESALWFRQYNNNSASPNGTGWQQWAKVWTNLNDGAGSGLDADYVDGIQGSQFLRSDTADEFSGFLRVTNNNGLYVNHTNGQLNMDLDVSSNTFNVRGTSNQTLFQVRTSDNNAYFSGRLGIGTTSPSSSYRLSFGSGGIYMANNPIHYVSELHFNGNTRFTDTGNNNYLELRTGSTSHGGLQLTTNGVTRGYLYHNNSNHIGLLDAGGSWAIRHRNDEGTDFFTDGEVKEFSIGRDIVTGNYGTVQTHTTRGGYGGYSISGQYVFMSDGTNVGLYNDIDNEWMIYMKRNAEVELMYNGSTKLETLNTGVTVTGDISVTGTVDGQDISTFNVPGTPGLSSSTTNGDGIAIIFTAASSAEYYEIWSSVGNQTNFGLVGKVDPSSVASTMSYQDDTPLVTGTIYYRIYGINKGRYGAPLEFSHNFTYTLPDPATMVVSSDLTTFLILWEPVQSRLVGGYTLKHHATSGTPSEGSATAIYTGNNTTYFYNIPDSEVNLNHQFWVTANPR